LLLARRRPAKVVPAAAKKRQEAAHVAPVADAAAGPELNPDEWVAGDVIHIDRERAFGLIRCDRVRGHVRFQAADFKRAPRVGEKVRFKGRHGAMRKPVAIQIERLSGSGRTG
jgi:hypothetical protein